MQGTRKLRTAATDDKLGLVSNTSRYGIPFEAESTQQQLFIMTTDEVSLKIVLISNKAMAVAKSISEILLKIKNPNQPKEANQCACCGKKFVVLIRKKVLCFICDQFFCS